MAKGISRGVGAALALSALSCVSMAVATADGAYDDHAVDVQSACKSLPSQSQLHAVLVAARTASNGGFNLDMWGTMVGGKIGGVNVFGGGLALYNAQRVLIGGWGHATCSAASTSIASTLPAIQ